jgi:hypothetical protein
MSNWEGMVLGQNYKMKKRKNFKANKFMTFKNKLWLEREDMEREDMEREDLLKNWIKLLQFK